MTNTDRACKLTPEQLQSVRSLAGPWRSLRDTHRRHKGFGALVGGLLREGLAASLVEAVVEELALATDDDEVAKRVELVAATAAKLKDKEPVTGWPKLAECLGTDGQAVVGRFRIGMDVGLLLEDLATHKRLPVDYLRGLGLHDTALGDVGIPYKDGNGEVVLVKRRSRLQAGVGSHWPHGKELMAYGEDRLHAAPPTLVEGESDCWTLWHHGFPALGLPGTDTVRKTLHQRHVAPFKSLYVVQEPDEGGRDFVANVRSRLAELGWAGTLKVVRLDGAKDPSELHCSDPQDFPQRWRQAIDTAALLEVVAAEAPALATEPPWPDPLPEEAYHGLAGDLVRAIEPASEADPAGLLFQALVALGNVVARTAHFTAEADTHYLNEFLVLIGKTSKGRKGTSWGHIYRLVSSAEEEWARERVQSGLSSGEGLIWACRDPVMKREKVKQQGEIHYEEVEADPGVSDKRLLVYEPEFANVLKQVERQGNILSAVLRQAWESGDLRTLTKNNPARATGAHISLVGHCTTDELRRYLSTTEMANGFGNRHLWACVRRSKTLPEGGRIDRAVLDCLRDRLVEVIGFARSSGALRRDEEARELWHTVYPELSEGKPGMAGALLARGEAHVMRLAGLYALLDLSAEVRAEHLLAALALWQYVEQSVRHVFGDSLGDPVADDLLRLLRGSPQGLSRTEISNHFGRNQPAERVGRALAMLAEHKLAHARQETTGGRPAERWHAGPPPRR